jgi:predicted nucleic acid-binding protein
MEFVLGFQAGGSRTIASSGLSAATARLTLAHRLTSARAQDARRRAVPTSSAGRDAGQSMNVNDLWIASIASAHDLLVLTQDDDSDVVPELGLVAVISI